MQISIFDHAEINHALLELDSLYRPNPSFTADIIEKARFICKEALERPEFWEGGFNMDAGLEAVKEFLHEQYPWLTEEAVWAVHHWCMMAMK